MATMNAPWYTIGYQAIRVVDMQARTYSVVATSPTGRWYPTVATQPDGNMLIVGGAQEVILYSLSYKLQTYMNSVGELYVFDCLPQRQLGPDCPDCCHQV